MSDDLIADLESIRNEIGERKPTGSMRDGTMRAVGYSTAQGYIDALARGVKQATADSYKQILRGTYGMTSAEVAALPCVVMDNNGVTVVHNVLLDLDAPATVVAETRAEIEFHSLLELD